MKKIIGCVICAIAVLVIILCVTYLPPTQSGGRNSTEPAPTETTETAPVPTEPSVPATTIPSESVGWLSVQADIPVGFEGIICIDIQNVNTGLLDTIQLDALSEYCISYRLYTGKYFVSQAYVQDSDHFTVEYPEDVIAIGTGETTLQLSIAADQLFEEELEDILSTYEAALPPESDPTEPPEVEIGPTSYFSISCPDTDYVGHAVPNLTASQIQRIKNTIYGEAGASFETMLLVAQCIRDNVDRSYYVTYDNFVTECQFYGGYEERPASVYNTPQVKQVFDYIFVQGNNAVQHPIYCFYTRTSSLKTDDDYQALFFLPLEFVIEVENTRFFCWDE